jgi:hypothetical protein
VWLTVGNPESSKSAPNCFSGLGSNKHQPQHDLGQSMGVRGVHNGFITPYAKCRKGRIKNTRDSGTGLDKDYHLYAEPDGGCCGPVVQGPECAVVFGPEGWFAIDLEREALISEAIWLHAPTAMGDFSYEAPLCIAATAADDDTAHLAAKVMRGALHVLYRSSGSLPNRRVVYDFSTNRAESGVRAMLRANGEPWGWSTPHYQAFTELAEGRRSDGAHLYGWSEANAGSTGDGRIDEFETGDYDNGSVGVGEISGRCYTRIENADSMDDIAAQEIYFRHNTPTSATVSRTFTRSHLGLDTYTGTPSSNDSGVSLDLWGMGFSGARVATSACFIGWLQTAGGASELRQVVLRAKTVRQYKLGASS